MSTTTKQFSSSTISVTWANSLWTSLPDSENHFEKSECELISINLPWSYLCGHEVSWMRFVSSTVLESVRTDQKDGSRASGLASDREKFCQFPEGHVARRR